METKVRLSLHELKSLAFMLNDIQLNISSLRDNIEKMRSFISKKIELEEEDWNGITHRDY